MSGNYSFKFEGEPSPPQINSEGRIISVATTSLSSLSCVLCLSTSLILIRTVVRGHGNIQRIILLMAALTDLSASILAATSSWIFPESSYLTKSTTSCTWTLTIVTFLNGLTSCSLVAIAFDVHDTLINGQFKQLTGKRLFFLVTFTTLLATFFALYHHSQPVAPYGLRLLNDNQTVVCSFRTTAQATRFDRVVSFLHIMTFATLPILAILVQSLNSASHAIRKVRCWREREAARITIPNLELVMAMDFLRSNVFKLSMAIISVKFFFQFPFIIVTMTARISPSPLTSYITISQMINQVGILTSSMLFCPLLSAIHVVHWKNAIHRFYNSIKPQTTDNMEVASSTALNMACNIEMISTQTQTIGTDMTRIDTQL